MASRTLRQNGHASGVKKKKKKNPNKLSQYITNFPVSTNSISFLYLTYQIQKAAIAKVD